MSPLCVPKLWTLKFTRVFTIVFHLVFERTFRDKKLRFLKTGDLSLLETRPESLRPACSTI